MPLALDSSRPVCPGLTFPGASNAAGLSSPEEANASAGCRERTRAASQWKNFMGVDAVDTPADPQDARKCSECRKIPPPADVVRGALPGSGLADRALDRVDRSVDVLLGRGPVRDRDAHQALSPPGRRAHPAGSFALHGGDDLFGARVAA